MVNWKSLIDENALASVIPGKYAVYVRPVRDALVLFLEGLAPSRQAAILAEQASLPPTASASERLSLLARSCPTLHKLGQVLARDRGLAPEFRLHLQKLESLAPTTSQGAIHDTLTHELGPLNRLGVTLAPTPLAEASVAVVIPFRYERSVKKGGPRQGVFKILKPGIEERLEQELGLLERVGACLDESCDDYGIPPLRYRESFELVRDKLRQEIRLDMEQRHLAEARAVYQSDPRILVPTLFDYCTPRVTAMERVTGHKVTEHRLESASRKRRLAGLVVDALVARPVFSRSDRSLFHGDPHAGNLFFTDDRRLAILDWSLVGSLDESQRSAIAQIALGGMTYHAERVMRSLAGLAERHVDLAALRSVVHAWLGRIRQGHLPGFTWLVGLLDEAMKTARLHVGADLMLFRKSLHTIDGVVADLGAAEHRTDDVLWGHFLRHLAGEWPHRWLAWPDSRRFATRLSNADLMHWMLSLPSAAMRFWLDASFDADHPTPP